MSRYILSKAHTFRIFQLIKKILLFYKQVTSYIHPTLCWRSCKRRFCCKNTVLCLSLFETYSEIMSRPTEQIKLIHRHFCVTGFYCNYCAFHSTNLIHANTFLKRYFQWVNNSHSFGFASFFCFPQFTLNYFLIRFPSAWQKQFLKTVIPRKPKP